MFAALYVLCENVSRYGEYFWRYFKMNIGKLDISKYKVFNLSVIDWSHIKQHLVGKPSIQSHVVLYINEICFLPHEPHSSHRVQLS